MSRILQFRYHCSELLKLFVFSNEVVILHSIIVFNIPMPLDKKSGPVDFKGLHRYFITFILLVPEAQKIGLTQEVLFTHFSER